MVKEIIKVFVGALVLLALYFILTSEYTLVFALVGLGIATSWVLGTMAINLYEDLKDKYKIKKGNK